MRRSSIGFDCPNKLIKRSGNNVGLAISHAFAVSHAAALGIAHSLSKPKRQRRIWAPVPALRGPGNGLFYGAGLKPTPHTTYPQTSSLALSLASLRQERGTLTASLRRAGRLGPKSALRAAEEILDLAILGATPPTIVA
jgi:hypothetical protein